MGNRAKTIIFFGLIFLVLLSLQVFQPGFRDPDGYYHVQMAQVLSEGRILQQFPWLTQTTWAERYADQHLLYHFLLIPAAKIDPIFGIQVFHAILVLAMAAVYWFLLKKLGADLPKLWLALLLFGSLYFLLRISLVKAIPLGLILLFLSINFLFAQKTAWLAVVSFLFVWSYGGFVFLPLLFIAFIICKFLSGEKVPWKLIIIPSLALLLALLVHPNASNLPYHLYTQIFQAGLGYKIPVGAEWSPASPTGLAGGVGLILGIWVIALYQTYKRRREGLRSPSLLFFFFTSFFFLLLMLKSQRFVEYFVPFAVLFSALALNPVLTKISWPHIKDKVFKAPLTYLSPILSGASLILVVGVKIYELGVPEQAKWAPYQFYGAARYLAENSPTDSVVFNTLWDEFPLLFFWNQHNRYIAGMDPMFMYERDQKKYWLAQHLADDELLTCARAECTDNIKDTRSPHDVIKNEFGAAYVFLEHMRNPKLKQHLENSAYFKNVYSDDRVAVYKVL